MSYYLLIFGAVLLVAILSYAATKHNFIRERNFHIKSTNLHKRSIVSNAKRWIMSSARCGRERLYDRCRLSWVITNAKVFISDDILYYCRRLTSKL